MRELKVGMSLFSLTVDPGGSQVIDEWIITVIKVPNTKFGLFSRKEKPDPSRKEVYVVRKDEFTWVRAEDKRKYHYIWAKSISSYDKDSFLLSSYLEKGLPKRFSFSEAGAIKKAIAECKKEITETKAFWVKERKIPQKDSEADMKAQEVQELKDLDNALMTIKRMRTNRKNKETKRKIALGE